MQLRYVSNVQSIKYIENMRINTINILKNKHTGRQIIKSDWKIVSIIHELQKIIVILISFCIISVLTNPFYYIYL